MELLDIYDDFGNLTGKTVVRGNKYNTLKSNEHIALAVIFIENSKGEFLIQKASVEKGNIFSSTGGHVTSKETPLTTVIREVKEELGIDISGDDVISLGYLLYDMPIRYMYYLKKDIDINDVTIQKEEVAYVKYASVQEILDLIKNNKFLKSHGLIFKEVLRYKHKTK